MSSDTLPVQSNVYWLPLPARKSDISLTQTIDSLATHEREIVLSFVRILIDARRPALNDDTD